MITASPSVSRGRLLRRLDSARPVAVIAAPAGFGKSTLLRSWHERLLGGDESRPAVVFVSVPMTRADDGGDGDSGGDEFWRRLAASLPAANDGTAHAARSEAISRLHRLARERAIVLLVDGLDRLGDGSAALVLADLVDEGVLARLVIAVRAFSGPLRHTIARHAPTVFSADDLAFSAAEIEELMGAADRAADPSAAEIAQLTGGWPLLTVACLEPDDAGDETSASAGADRVRATIRSLFATRHLEPSSARAAAIALIALSEDLTGSLARTLVGDAYVENILRWLVDEGLLIPDAGGELYRWPTSVRAAMLVATAAELRTAPARIHSVVGRWYLDRAEPAAALRHATLGEDWALARAVLEAHSRTLLFAHTYDELYAALHRMPLTQVRKSALVVGLRDIWLHVPDDMLDAAAALPGSEEALIALGRSRSAQRALEAGYVIVMAISRRGDIERARDYGARLLRILETARDSQPDRVLELYPALHLHVGLLHLVGGDTASGLSSLWRAYERASDNPRPYIASDAASKMALAYATLGEPRRAEIWLDRHRAAPLRSARLEPRVRCTADAAELLRAVDALDLVAAAAAYARVIEFDTFPQEIFWAYLGYAEAQYALATEAFGEMLDHLERLESNYPQWLGGGAIAGPLLDAARAELLLALGRGNQASAVLFGTHRAHPLLRVAQARFFLLTERPADALRLASDAEWEARAMTRDRINMKLIHAVAARRTGDAELAAATLQRALDAAELVGALRPFTAVPRDDLMAIATTSPDRRTSSAVTALLDSPALQKAREVYPLSASFVELTTREQDILAQLSSEKSLQQIAISRRISYNTVKIHVRHIYQKLGVSSREDATARALEYGLLT